MKNPLAERGFFYFNGKVFDYAQTDIVENLNF